MFRDIVGAMDTQVDPVPPTAADVPPMGPGPAAGLGAPAVVDAKLHELGTMVERESAFVDQVTAETGKVVIGQTYMIERILIGLLTGGHCLIEGVPGLAKTLTVKTLSQTIHASFQRIQFTEL